MTRNIVVGVGRLAFDAVQGLTGVVEAMHGTIVRRPLPVGRLTDTRTTGITRFVYTAIRSTTRFAGAGVDGALALLAPLVGEPASSPRREAVLAAVNGVIGDHLAATGNPLAIPMRLHGASVGRVVVLVHGLCMSHLQWRRRGHDHGAALAREGWNPVYAHYNTGRHISHNGRELAERLEELAASELVIVGHSMGGLVARSACHHARLAGQRWLDRVSKLIFLGTPHHGAPLERIGNGLDSVLEISPYVAPLARIAGNRSAGIADLRFGSLVDEDWAGRDRRQSDDPRTPVPLPAGIACYTIAATRGRRRGDLKDRVLGDGLVPSALGHHRDPRFALGFPPDHQRVVYGCDHFDLLDAPAVYDQLAAWLR
jgi:pimeloyl-ACP methyl ester carboxylesterase